MGNRSPEASIVIPTRNRCQLLLRTLERFEHQTTPKERFEVVVADDGSSDETSSLLKASGYSFTLRWVTHEHRKGAAGARNSGIGLASGRIIIFLDDDILVLPDFVARHLADHEHQPRRVVLGNILTHPEAGSSPLSRYVDSRGVHKLAAGERPPFRYFVAANSSVPRELLDAAGWFDEQLSEYGGEDLELGYRLSQAGAEFFFDRSIRVGHWKKYSVSDLCRDLATMGERSLPRILAKHPDLREHLGISVRGSGASSLKQGRGLFREIGLSLIGSPPLYAIVKHSARVLENFWVPFFVFDYLVFFSRRRGYSKTAGRTA